MQKIPLLDMMSRSWQKRKLAFQIADRYISIQETEGGYDYSIMGTDYKEIDGGVYDNPDVSIRKALSDIMEDLKENPFDNGARGNIRGNNELIPIDYDGLMKKVDEANYIEPSNDIVADLFNENGLHIGGVKVDINPITAQRTGSLETYLLQVENSLEGVREKAAYSEVDADNVQTRRWENEPMSIFNIRINDEERWFKNTSGLDAEGLCKAYAECGEPM